MIVSDILTIGEYTATAVYDNSAVHSEILIVNCGEESADISEKICCGKSFIFVSVGPVCWERDYTPWKSPGLNSRSDFSGGADEYLKIITDKIIPAFSEKYNVPRGNAAICGYSLGGLLSLYAALKCDIFKKTASVSGSLWYENWVRYLKDNSVGITLEKCYISLGDTEGKTKNSLMKTVDLRTAETCDVLSGISGSFKFEYNPGGHFKNVEERMKRAVDFLS